MSKNESNSYPVMPDPVDVARRVALFDGDFGLNPDDELSSGARQEVFFSLADDRQAGSAVVNVRRFAAATHVVDGQEVPKWSGGRYAFIGHFDVADQAWRFYPEYVGENEQQRLSESFDEMGDVGTKLLKAQAEEGSPFADLRHPITVEARQEMKSILDGSGLLERFTADTILDSHGYRGRVDDSTSATIELMPKLCGPGVRGEPSWNDSSRMDPSQFGITFNQVLTIGFKGLIVTDTMGNTKRRNNLFHIAQRSMDDETVWLPDLGVITVDEFDVLSVASRRLLEYQQLHPDFSTEHCAIVQNFQH